MPLSKIIFLPLGLLGLLSRFLLDFLDFFFEELSRDLFFDFLDFFSFLCLSCFECLRGVLASSSAGSFLLLFFSIGNKIYLRIYTCM